jgi:Cellulose binding domain
MRRLIVLAVAALLVLAGVSAPASGAPACLVNYAANQWAGGFTADVRVTNGGAAVSSWTLSWTWVGDQRVTNSWNATVTQAGNVVTASSAGWNGPLGTGASATFGLQGTVTGANTAPAAFTFNGVSCGDDAEPPDEPSTPPAASCGSAAICDGFENQAATVPGGDWAVAYPDCSGAGQAAIDRTVAHTGTASLRVDGAAGYCNHVFVRNARILGTGGNVWYVRYWVRHTTALPVSHVTTVALRDDADGGRDLRFGGQNGALQFNRASDDATLPEQSPAGVALSAPLPTGTWNCVEFKIDGVGGTIETWLNGTAVPGLVVDGIPTHDIDSQWLNRLWRPRLSDLRLGWESYGEGVDTLWYDDIVAGSTRSNC